MAHYPDLSKSLQYTSCLQKSKGHTTGDRRGPPELKINILVRLATSNIHIQVTNCSPIEIVQCINLFDYYLAIY